MQALQHQLPDGRRRAVPPRWACAASSRPASSSTCAKAAAGWSKRRPWRAAGLASAPTSPSTPRTSTRSRTTRGSAACLAVCAELRRGTGEACVLEFFLPADCRDNAAAEAVAATIRARFGNGDLKEVALRGSQELALEVLADDDEWADHAIVADTPELGLDDHGGYERDSDEEDDVHLEAAVGEADAEAPEMNNGEREQGEDPEQRASRRRREKKAGKRKNEKTVSLEELKRYFSREDERCGKKPWR
jgi:hypothetical protein